MRGCRLILEPRAASPLRRLRAIETLSRAGIPVHVNVAPVIPFINEPEIEKLLEAAANAGAVKSHYTVLRLPWEVSPLFEQWLATHFPDRAQRVLNRVREMRDGKNYDANFGTRMKGSGTWAALVRQRFDKASAKLGLDRKLADLRTDLFVAPKPASPQMPALCLAREPERVLEVGLEQQGNRRHQRDRAAGQRGDRHQHRVPAALVAPSGWRR